MVRIISKNEWPLVRFIVPAFPEVNIFTRQARVTTALGPVMVATAANKLWGWRVEIIDENNYHGGPRDSRGLPNHSVLQKENPASVVAFYCGLTSTMERVWELAKFYHHKRVTTIAGGWHAHYCPEETLRNNVDVVVHGDGEIVIQHILKSLKEGNFLGDILGISFLEDGQVRVDSSGKLEIPNLNDLPYPDFGLLRYAKMKIYPISRIRGCGMNCEFCSVKGKPRWADSQYLFNMVQWLVETRKARRFFIVDDRLEEDINGTVEFFRMVSRKYGDQLRFTVQIRLETAKNSELLRIMKEAGVRVACIGCESPIDEDLKAMCKGYLSTHMLEWIKILRHYFWVHGMFMVGYPLKNRQSSISVAETIKRFRRFLRKASFGSVQILHPIPLVGTALRRRLEKEGRLFPLEVVPWSKYDGNYVCFAPDNMTIREFQEIPMKLMRWFYNPWSFFKIPMRIISFPVDYLVRGWKDWYRNWLEDIIKYGGHLLIQRWQKRQRSNFVKGLERYQRGKELV